MTAPDVPREPPRQPQRGGCLSALLVLFGLFLLLPGICSLLFMVTVRATPDLWSLWIATYVVAAAGIVLIIYVSRNRPR